MRNSLAFLTGLLLLFPVSGQEFRLALPGYHYEFPRDHFSHPDFQTEWWYYTGNVRAADGHRFGFELTFFRQALDRNPSKTSVWDVRDLYLAHLALSDLDARGFYHAERLNRSGPGIAGVLQNDGRIWNGNWRIDWKGNEQTLQAIDNRFTLELDLRAQKPPIIHGENGVSQKLTARVGPRTIFPSRGWLRKAKSPWAGKHWKFLDSHGWTMNSLPINWTRTRRDGTGLACSWKTTRS